MQGLDIDSLRILLENAPDGFFVHDVSGRILDANARSCADLGYTRDELLGLTIDDISCGATPAQNAVNWRSAPPGSTRTFHETAVRKDGTTFPVEISIACQDVAGRKLFMGLARDMTEAEAARLDTKRLQAELEARVLRRTAELAEARERLVAVLDSALDAIILHDTAGRCQMLNLAAARMMGIARQDAIGRDAVEIFGPQTGARMLDHHRQVLATGTPSTVEEVVLIAGDERFLLTTRTVHRAPDGTVLGLVCVARDMTELKRSERDLRDQHQRLEMAARVGGLGIWDYDVANDVLHCDEQWYAIMGRDPASPIRSIEEFRPFIHPEDADRVTEVLRTSAELLSVGMDYQIAFRIIRPDGEVRWVRSAARLLDNATGTAHRAVGFLTDVTDSWLAEEWLRIANLSLQEEKEVLARRGEELGKQALEDPLTGLGNRRYLERELDRACRHAARSGEPLAVAMVDVDCFKLYNDHYGHAQGDAALRAVAQVLSDGARRPSDVVARHGGEEFVVVLPGVERPEAVFDRIRDGLAAMALPHAASPVDPLLTISCGCVVVSAAEKLQPTELLAASDRALYQAKETGRNRLVVITL